MINPKKAHLRHRKYTLPEGYSIKNLVIRELDGNDELEAARRIKMRGGSADDANVLALNENLRISVVAVNDIAVDQPYHDMDTWSSNTRRFLIEAWSDLNSLPDDHVKDFLEAAEDLTLDQAPAAQVVG